MNRDLAPYMLAALLKEWKRINNAINTITVIGGMGKQALAQRRILLDTLYPQLRAVAAEIDKWGALVYGDQPIALLPASIGPRVIYINASVAEMANAA